LTNIENKYNMEILEDFMKKFICGLFFVVSLIACTGTPKTIINETVTDIDGNVYHTITIGTQVWLMENLRTTKYNDGTVIPFIVDAADVWYELNAPGYCWYDNDESSKNITGALYNWYAVNTGKLAPKGWRVPSDEDWQILIDYLGGENIAGGKMKETGSAHWFEPNTGATNSSGFTALHSGYRGKEGFIPLSIGAALFWSSSEFDDKDILIHYLSYNNEAVGRKNGGKYHGLSVRCVKD
jgi:uncharacterized protein (TIGR02145 family)